MTEKESASKQQQNGDEDQGNDSDNSNASGDTNCEQLEDVAGLSDEAHAVPLRSALRHSILKSPQEVEYYIQPVTSSPLEQLTTGTATKSACCRFSSPASEKMTPLMKTVMRRVLLAFVAVGLMQGGSFLFVALTMGQAVYRRAETNNAGTAMNRVIVFFV